MGSLVQRCETQQPLDYGVTIDFTFQMPNGYCGRLKKTSKISLLCSGGATAVQRSRHQTGERNPYTFLIQLQLIQVSSCSAR
jgi:hypothetical protein